MEIRFLVRLLILYKKGIKFKLAGNQVYYTNPLILLVKNLLCRKIHCQKVLIFIPFSYEISHLGPRGRFGGTPEPGQMPTASDTSPLSSGIL